MPAAAVVWIRLEKIRWRDDAFLSQCRGDNGRTACAQKIAGATEKIYDGHDQIDRCEGSESDEIGNE